MGWGSIWVISFLVKLLHFKLLGILGALILLPTLIVSYLFSIKVAKTSLTWLNEDSVWHLLAQLCIGFLYFSIPLMYQFKFEWIDFWRYALEPIFTSGSISVGSLVLSGFIALGLITRELQLPLNVYIGSSAFASFILFYTFQNAESTERKLDLFIEYSQFSFTFMLTIALFHTGYKFMKGELVLSPRKRDN